MVNYGILPDGRRIYIDSFRDRPGMDMSYQPADFDQRFVLPQVRISLFLPRFNFILFFSRHRQLTTNDQCYLKLNQRS